jgi:hypothetical protein
LSDRIQLIDALRGLALAGIAMVHFGEQYLGYMPPPGVPYNVHGAADGVLEALAWIFIRGKGFGLFSLMFGLSFALHMLVGTPRVVQRVAQGPAPEAQLQSLSGSSWSGGRWVAAPRRAPAPPGKAAHPISRAGPWSWACACSTSGTP